MCCWTPAGSCINLTSTATPNPILLLLLLLLLLMRSLLRLLLPVGSSCNVPLPSSTTARTSRSSSTTTAAIPVRKTRWIVCIQGIKSCTRAVAAAIAWTSNKGMWSCVARCQMSHSLIVQATTCLSTGTAVAAVPRSSTVRKGAWATRDARGRVCCQLLFEELFCGSLSGWFTC
jgi:hypothetical protein